MKNTNLMKKEIHEKLERAREINDLARVEKRNLTDAERTEFNQLMLEISDEQAELRTETRKQAEEMGSEYIDPIDGEQPAPLRGAMAWGQNESRTIKNPKSYRSMFYRNEKQELDKGGFKNIGEFLQVVNSGRHDPRLAELRQQQIGEGALGGFSVPEEFSAWLSDHSLEDEVIRSRATVHDMQSPTKHVPAWDSLDKTGGQLYGGLSAVWVGELEENQPQEARMRSMTLQAKKLAIYANVSNELLQDGQDFENNLGRAMVNAMGYGLDEAFINGTGAGQPQGILNNPALMTVNRTGFPSSAPGDTYIDLVNMYRCLFKGGPGQPIWLMHPDVAPDLIVMTDATGNLIWQSNARDNVPGRLFNYPIVYSEKMPAPTEPGCVALVNLYHYHVGLRKELYLDKSNAPGWTQDFSSYRSIIRADGQGSWNQTMTLPDGAEVSWSIALE